MELKNNKYLADGVEILSLVKKYGSPLYVYETAKMKSQYKKLSEAFGDIDMRLNYACKALTNINILKLFKSLGAGLDAELILSLINPCQVAGHVGISSRTNPCPDN